MESILEYLILSGRAQSWEDEQKYHFLWSEASVMIMEVEKVSVRTRLAVCEKTHFQNTESFEYCYEVGELNDN